MLAVKNSALSFPKPVSTAKPAVSKPTVLSAAGAKQKNAVAKEFSATTNQPVASSQLRVAPKTVQMQKGPIPDKMGARSSNPKPFSPQALIGSFKKGGRVKKTGIYKLHKGEHVLNAEQTKRADERVEMESPMARVLGKRD
jgi:hypothetical protein